MVEDRANILSSWARSIVSVVVPFVTVPILLSSLGTETFGLWQFASQLAAALLLFDTGITNASVRIFAKRENNASEFNAIKSSLFVIACLSLLLLVLAFPAGYGLGHLALTSDDGSIDGALLFAGCFCYAGLVLSTRPFAAYLYSRHRFVFINLSEAVFNIVKLIILVALSSDNSLSLAMTFFTIFGCQLVQHATLASYALIVDKKIFAASFRAPLQKSAISHLFSQSFASATVSFGAIILNSGFVFFLGLRGEFFMVATASLAVYLIMATTPFFQAFVTVMAPRAAKLKDNAAIVEFFSNVQIALNMITVPLISLAFLIAIQGPWIFGIWLGDNEADGVMLTELSVLFAIMLACYSVGISSNFLRIYILGAGNFHLPGRIDIATSLLGLAISITVYSFGFGVMALGVGFCFTIISRLMLYTLLVHYRLRVDMKRIIFLVGRSVSYAVFLLIITSYFSRHHSEPLSSFNYGLEIGWDTSSVLALLLYSLYARRKLYMSLK